MIPESAAVNESSTLAILRGGSERAISFEELQRSLEVAPWSRDGVKVLLADEDRIRLAIDGGERDNRWVLLYSEVIEKIWLLQMIFLSQGEERQERLKDRIEERRGIARQALSRWQRAFNEDERLSLRKVMAQLEKFEAPFPQKIIAIFADLRENASENILREYSLGDLYEELKDYQRCIKHCQVCLSLHQQLPPLPAEAKHAFLLVKGAVHTNLGLAHYRLGNYQEALANHQQHLQIAEELGNRDGVGIAYGNIGNAHLSLGNYQEALEKFQKALAIAEELGNRDGVAAAYGNIGNARYRLGNYREALENYQKHLQIAEGLGNRGRVGMVYVNIGSAHQALSNYREALENYQKHLQIAEELGERGGVREGLREHRQCALSLRQLPRGFGELSEAAGNSRRVRG